MSKNSFEPGRFPPPAVLPASASSNAGPSTDAAPADIREEDTWLAKQSKRSQARGALQLDRRGKESPDFRRPFHQLSVRRPSGRRVEKKLDSRMKILACFARSLRQVGPW